MMWQLPDPSRFCTGIVRISSETFCKLSSYMFGWDVPWFFGYFDHVHSACSLSFFGMMQTVQTENWIVYESISNWYLHLCLPIFWKFMSPEGCLEVPILPYNSCKLKIKRKILSIAQFHIFITEMHKNLSIKLLFTQTNNFGAEIWVFAIFWIFNLRNL